MYNIKQENIYTNSGRYLVVLLMASIMLPKMPLFSISWSVLCSAVVKL